MDNRRIKITWEPVSVTDKDSLVQIIKHELDRLIKATEEGLIPSSTCSRFCLRSRSRSTGSSTTTT